MPSKFHVPADVSEIDHDLPIVAIDLSGAYAEPAPQKTGYLQPRWNGIKDHTGPVTQAKAAKLFNIFLSGAAEMGTEAVNLILEAPLSYAFAPGPKDFPLNAQRRPVERKTNYSGLDCINDDRPWIRNAGAATALVALLFLKAVQPRIPKSMTINLFEGLWSWIGGSSPHQGDVEGLIKGFQEERIVPAKLGEQQAFQTALQLLGDDSPTAARPPLIVFGHPDLAAAYKPTDHSAMLASQHLPPALRR